MKNFTKHVERVGLFNAVIGLSWDSLTCSKVSIDDDGCVHSERIV